MAESLDTITISGLSAALDEDTDLPYLDLSLACAGRTYRAAILGAEEEWTVNLRDERGRSCPGSGELYATQADAIVAALYMALEMTRLRIP